MRYLAFKLPGLEPLHPGVPLDGVSIYEAVNEPSELTGTLRKALAYDPVAVEGTDEMVPLITRRGTLLVADDGNRVQAFIVEDVDEVEEDQDALSITAVGFGWLPKDEPWDTDRFDGVEVDPLDVVRRIYEYVTSHSDAIDITVDDTTSDVTVGEEEEEVEFETSDGEQVSFDAGPYRLNWWSTDDLYKKIEDLALETPFEWSEETTMSRQTDAPPSFRIRLGYPRIEPVVREDHQFQIGLNVTEPQQPDDEEFFTEVFVIGNGDGSKKRRGSAKRKGTGRHRKVKVISDQSLTSNELCRRAAQDEVDRADRDTYFIEACRVHDHPAAPVGTFGKGDVIYLQGETVWSPDHHQKCRIVAMERRMSDNSVQLTLERWD